MTVSIGTHDLRAGQSFKFRPESLGFQCGADNYTRIKYYPRSKDPVYETAVPIVSVAGTTITTQVGITTEVKYNIRFAAYTPQTGIMTVSLDRLHNFQVGESIKFSLDLSYSNVNRTLSKQITSIQDHLIHIMKKL